MKVVVNATPIISLARIGKLQLLKELYGKVFVAKEVYTETVEYGRHKQDIDAIGDCPFIDVIEVKNALSVEMLMTELDRGKSETIVLAKEIMADLVIMDETLGREIAEAKGLNVTETIGVLIEAKYKNLIPEVKRYLDLLKNKGFWISDQLYNQIIERLRE